MIQKKTSKKNQNSAIKKIEDDKLKPLIPTLRDKKRFLRIKINSSKKIEFKELSENIVDEILIYMGAIDYAKGGIWILRDKFNFEKQEFVIRVSLKMKTKLFSSINLIDKIGNEKVKFNILRISGTLKGVYKEK